MAEPDEGDGDSDDDEPLYLNPTDRDVLETLARYGCGPPAWLAERTGRHDKTIASRLKRLREHEPPAVERRGRGCHHITAYGCERLEEHVDDVTRLELEREELVENGTLTERGEEWLERLEELRDA